MTSFFFFLFWWVVIREGNNPSAANSSFFCAAVYLGSWGRYLPVPHTSPRGRRTTYWLQDKERPTGGRGPSCEHFAPSQADRVLNSAPNSVTKALRHTFGPQLAGAPADKPCCHFSTTTCAWQNSSSWRLSRGDSRPGMGCCMATLSSNSAS